MTDPRIQVNIDLCFKEKDEDSHMYFITRKLSFTKTLSGISEQDLHGLLKYIKQFFREYEAVEVIEVVDA